ncbi:MAG: hypothetical protein ACK49C_03750 [Ignavibacteria bacterium]
MNCFQSALFIICFSCMVNVAPLKAQFEEDLPQITTEDTLKSSIRTVWKGIKRAFNELGTFSDPSTRDPKMDEKTGLYRGFIRSDFRVFASGSDTTAEVLERYGRLPVIRGGTWKAGRVKYEFKVRELAEDLTYVALVCGISGYEEGVTNEVHFWNSNGILDKEMLQLLRKLVMDPETENFKENRMK